MAKKKLIKGRWLAAEIKLLRKIYKNNSTAEVAGQLNRPLDAVKKKASRMGLRKAKSHIKKLGRS